MTFSIVALDAETGEIGAAAATCWPAVGAAVPWLEPGVGAVVTQALTERSHGPEGLRLLREGRSAPEILERLVAGDPGRERRQLGLLDAAGGSAAHTGRACVAEAGHVYGPGVSVQANMLEREGVWHAMLGAFREADGDLAARLLAALWAAEREGGDIRGQQSAALVVAPNDPRARPWVRRFDVRVDGSATPLDELARLLRVERAFEALEAALSAAASGDLGEGLRGTAVAHELAPENDQVGFWHGVVLLAVGQSDAGRALLVRTLRDEPGLAVFASRWAETEPDSALASVLGDVARLVGT